MCLMLVLWGIECCLVVVFTECVYDGGGFVYDFSGVLHGEVLG